MAGPVFRVVGDPVPSVGLTLGVWTGGVSLMAGPVAFVGREGELSRLLEAVGERARLVLVVGDAGVGPLKLPALSHYSAYLHTLEIGHRVSIPGSANPSTRRRRSDR